MLCSLLSHVLLNLLQLLICFFLGQNQVTRMALPFSIYTPKTLVSSSTNLGTADLHLGGCRPTMHPVTVFSILTSQTKTRHLIDSRILLVFYVSITIYNTSIFTSRINLI